VEFFNPETVIGTVEALETAIGKIPFPMTLKVIDHLDKGAIHWIAESPLVFIGSGNGGSSIGITLGGGKPGFATADKHSLRVPVSLLDDPSVVRPGTAFGSLFLLPGTDETLRVNGRVAEVRNGEILVRVEECYGHCAKALIRSDFWSVPDENAPLDAADFVGASRFMALATMDANGSADLSPKGDPAGKMASVNEDRIWFADRPGNRRTDSFHNIVTQPQVAAAFLIPGSLHVCRVLGTARMTINETVRARFIVQGKTPALAIAIDINHLELQPSGALSRAGIWPAGEPTHGIKPAQLFLEHTKLNKHKSFGARLASAALSLPGSKSLMEKGLKKDYKDNLY
jgi:predicted pyridoxine 5'-phosphate oxidase superfamily flavin-nucleotide-binding protein